MTALLTDRYELSMLTTALHDGTADRPAVFEAFARRLPEGRGYGLVAGTQRVAEMISELHFDANEIDWLLAEQIIDDVTASHLADYRFTGTITGLLEGDLYFANTPVLTVEASYGDALLLETLILSALNHDCAVASAAVRMVDAARGRPLIEMGSRRTHERAAVDAARAAYIAGFSHTSNLAAGRAYGIPTTGTAAHASILVRGADFAPQEGEMAAFRAQVKAHGPDTTLLVDTYDIAQGIRNAVVAVRAECPDASGPGAIRIDSGDLALEAFAARKLLDELGARDTRITITSDVDEYTLDDPAMATAPVDGFGAGTRVVTGSGHPTAGMVYKLVSREGADGAMVPLAKKAEGKGSSGGRKTISRTYDRGTLVAERHVVDGPAVDGDYSPQVVMIRDGVLVEGPDLAAARKLTWNSVESLPDDVRGVHPSEKLTPTSVALEGATA